MLLYKNDDFSIYACPFEEFEYAVIWHSYKRLDDSRLMATELANLMLPDAELATVLLDLLGCNGTGSSRFFELKIEKSARYQISRKIFEQNGLPQSIEPLVQWCDSIQKQNYALLENNSVLSKRELTFYAPDLTEKL